MTHASQSSSIFSALPSTCLMTDIRGMALSQIHPDPSPRICYMHTLRSQNFSRCNCSYCDILPKNDFSQRLATVTSWHQMGTSLAHPLQQPLHQGRISSSSPRLMVIPASVSNSIAEKSSLCRLYQGGSVFQLYLHFCPMPSLIWQSSRRTEVFFNNSFILCWPPRNSTSCSFVLPSLKLLSKNCFSPYDRPVTTQSMDAFNTGSPTDSSLSISQYCLIWAITQSNAWTI